MNKLTMTHKDNNYSVYCHTNKSNGKRYFGITRQNPERRWQKGNGYAKTTFGNAINKYGWDGFTHEVIISGLTKEVACNLEISLITAYRTYKGYVWEYADIDFEKPKHVGCGNYVHDKSQKKVRMTDENGEHIFNSIKEAAEYVGVKSFTVSRYLTGSRTDKKRGWSYAS